MIQRTEENVERKECSACGLVQNRIKYFPLGKTNEERVVCLNCIKKCSVCDIENPIDEYHRVANSEKRRAMCADCVSAINYYFRESHKELFAGYREKYKNESPEQRKQRKKLKKQCIQKIREYNVEKQREYRAILAGIKVEAWKNVEKDKLDSGVDWSQEEMDRRFQIELRRLYKIEKDKRQADENAQKEIKRQMFVKNMEAKGSQWFGAESEFSEKKSIDKEEVMGKI